MKIFLPGRFGGCLLIASVIAMGSLVSSDSMLIWRDTRQIDQKPMDKRIDRCVFGVSWSADGESVLAKFRICDSAVPSIIVYDVMKPPRRRFVWGAPFETLILDATLSPDGRHALLANESRGLWWVDLETLEILEIVEASPSLFLKTAVSHDGRLLAGATCAGAIYICNPTDGKSIVLASSRSLSPSRLQFSSDDHQILLAQTGGLIEVWDTETGTLLQELGGEIGLTSSALLPENKVMVLSSEVYHIQIRDLTTGEVHQRIPHGISNSRSGTSLDVSADGSLAAWCGNDHQITVCDLQQPQRQFHINNPVTVWQIRFSPNGKLLAVIGREQMIRFYDSASGREVKQIDTDPQPVI